ncbi:hypothetical protein BpHYR1_043086, partial [Brachionus plicatilis]
MDDIKVLAGVNLNINEILKHNSSIFFRSLKEYSIVNLYNYRLYDKKRLVVRGGGVAIYVRFDLESFEVRNEHTSHNSSSNSASSLILAGDFNFPDVKWF